MRRPRGSSGGSYARPAGSATRGLRHWQFMRSGDPQDLWAANVRRGRTGVRPCHPFDRLSYTITMRSIIPAREGLARALRRPSGRLAYRERDVHQLRTAHDLQRERAPGRHAAQAPVQRTDAVDRLIVHGHDQVPGLQVRLRGRALTLARQHLDRARRGEAERPHQSQIERPVARAHTARRTGPWVRISVNPHCGVEAGMAKPMPCAMAMIAVLMPATRPCPSTSGPPEFPGLSAALCCTTPSIRRPWRLRSGRASALTTPADTVDSNPKGLPTTTTS